MKRGICCFSKLYVSSLVLLVTTFFPFRVTAQANKHLLDSFQAALKTASDSEKIRIVAEQVVRLMDCKDSAIKIKLGEQAKQQAEKIKWDLEIANANRALGTAYFDCMHNYAKGFEFFQANVTLFQKNGDKNSESIALETVALHYVTLAQPAKAVRYFNMAIALNPEIGVKMGILGSMGVTYTNIGDYTHALSCYTNSLKLIDSLLRSKKGELQDTMQMAGLFLNIGDIYLSMSQPNRSFDNYKKALKISEETKDRYVEIWSLAGLAKTQIFTKEYSRAIENYLNALKYCDSLNAIKDKGKILSELAGAYLNSGDLGKALDCAQSALKLGEQYGLNEQLPKALTALGMVYLKHNQYQLATSYLQKAVAFSQKTGAMDEEKEAWQALSIAYKQMGKPALALDAFTHFISIRDSLHSIDKANELTRIDLQYSFDKKQMEDTAVYNEKIQRQRIFTYVSFVGVALVLLLSFFIYRNYNTQKKYNALLKKEKQSHLAQISAQDTVLSDIAHIQSHFVRGPIATIIGLLQFYNHEDPTDPVNKEVIEGITTSIEKLDNVVKEMVAKENKLRRESKKQ